MTNRHILIAIVGLLGLMFLVPIAYYGGKFVGLYGVCVVGHINKHCGREAAESILEGVRGQLSS